MYVSYLIPTPIGQPWQSGAVGDPIINLCPTLVSSQMFSYAKPGAELRHQAFFLSGSREPENRPMGHPECPGEERRLFKLSRPAGTDDHRLVMTAEISFLTDLEAAVHDQRVGSLDSSEASFPGLEMAASFLRLPTVLFVSTLCPKSSSSKTDLTGLEPDTFYLPHLL